MLRHKLQARLALLVVVAVLPIAGFSVFSALRDARLALQQTETALKLSASLAATSLDGLAESARGTLHAMAASSNVREGSAAACQSYLAQLRGRFPQYANFGVVDHEGYIRCQSRGATTERISVADRLYFREAIERRDFSVGVFMTGRVSGSSSVGFGLPLLDGSGQITGVVYAALDLGGLARTVAQVQLPPGARLSIVDRNGTLLASQSDDGAQPGTRVPSPVLQAAVQRGSAGAETGEDGSGNTRIYAFAPGMGAAGRALMVAISMDRDLVVDPSLRSLYFELGMLALLALLGMWGAWWLGGRMLTQPVRSILAAADGVASGELSQRVSLPERTAQELRGVGDALNRMADALQARQRQLHEELVRAQQTQATQALIFNSMSEGLWAIDTEGRMLLHNETAARLFDVMARMQSSSDWARSYGLYRPDSDELLPEADLPLVRGLAGQSGQIDLAVRNPRVPHGCLLRCTYRPLTGARGIIGALVVFTDITELRQAELQEVQTYTRLRETQRRLVDALRIGRIGNWEYDLSTRRIWWSDEVHEIFGVQRGGFDGRIDSVVERIHPDDRARYLGQREQALAEEAMLDIEFRILLPDGSVRWVQQRGEVHRGPQGQALRRAGVVQDITQRRKSEGELLLLRSAVECINDIVLIARDEHSRPAAPTVVYVNGALQRLTGLAADRVLGGPLPSFGGAETDPEVVARLRGALSSRQPLREEMLSYTVSGGQLWLEIDMVPFDEGADVPGHWIIVGRDVTARKLAEAALSASEERYQLLFDQAPLPMWVTDEKSGRFLAVNQAAVRHYGYARQEFLALGLHDVRPQRDRARLEQHLALGYADEADGWTHRRKDGSEFPVEVRSQPVVYAGRRARFALVSDISARVQAEQNLQEYLFTLQRATDATQLVVSHQTLQGTLHEVVEQARAVIRAHQGIVSLVNHGDWAHATSVISMSDKYARYRDFVDDPDGTGIYNVVTETNRPMRLTQQQLEAHPRWRGFGAYADRHPPMNGWLAVPLVNRRGENIGVLQLTDKYEGEFSLQDEYVAVELAQLATIAIENVMLLEEVRALNAGLEHKVLDRTRELAREQARYRALADQAPQIIWSYESGKGVTYFNSTWYELVGGTPDYWLSKRWMEVIHPDDRDTSLANWALARQSRGIYKGERRIRDKYGRYHIMSYRGAPVYDENGQVLCWVGIDTDITEFKEVEAQLRESNRELEAFSYSVSHDLRSPLNTIHGFSKLLARELDPQAGGRASHYLDRIQAAAGYMGQLIEDLLSLAQVSRANLRDEDVDLGEVARAILERLQQTDSQRVVRVAVQDHLVARGDVRLLRVMLENLLGNAWKFTSQQPQAEIEVGRRADGAFFVRDNGAGFDMKYADKLFGVFQRLHAATEFPGTGIGLATVHRIITRHHGHVWAESAPGRGATFFWTLGVGLVAPAPAPPLAPAETTKKPLE
jgi:PAS domain S-box-containing protein